MPNARRIDAATDRIAWGNSAALRITGDASLGVWLKVGAGSSNVWLVQRGEVGTVQASNHTIGLLLDGAAGSWDIRSLHDYGDGGPSEGENHTFDTNIPNDSWRYVGISRDTTAKTITLYLGNFASIVEIETWGYTNNAEGGSSSDAQFTIGDVPNGAGWQGDAATEVTFGHVAYYERSLSAEEHSLIMTCAPPLQGLLLFTKLEGASPETDLSGNGYAGTVNGTSVVAGKSCVDLPVASVPLRVAY